MKRIALLACGALAALFLTIYSADLAVLHLRANPYDAVAVQHYYAIAQKTGRIELQYDRTYIQQCARSLFPHGRLQPCWYLRRHTEQWTKI